MNDPILDGLSSAILGGEDGGEEEDLYKDHVHTVLWLGKGSLKKKSMQKRPSNARIFIILPVFLWFSARSER